MVGRPYVGGQRQVQPLHLFLLLQSPRQPTCSSCDLAAAKERLPRGSSPSSRHQQPESTSAGFPSPLRSVLGVSHAPDGFLLRLPCGFVSPRCHVQGSLFRVFPSREAARARRPPLPSCRFHCPPALSFIQWRQGTVSASRALLRSRVRGEQWWFRPPPARYPPELLPSSGSPSRAAKTTFVALSDHGLSRPSSCCQRAT